jgi:hypothetical protein
MKMTKKDLRIIYMIGLANIIIWGAIGIYLSWYVVSAVIILYTLLFLNSKRKLLKKD